MKIEIKHDLDTDGMTPIVLVPLTNSDQKVTLYADPVPQRGRRNQGRANASSLRCSRGSYRQHAAKGSNMNKGDPSGSSARLQDLPSRRGEKGLMTMRQAEVTW